jgi:hypothetical protein
MPKSLKKISFFFPKKIDGYFRNFDTLPVGFKGKF